MAKCVFCEILSGRVPGSIVWQDDDVAVLVDLRQPHDGHILIVPKLHVETIYDLDDQTGAVLMRTVTRMARALRQAYGPEGLNMWQSNGEAGGQEVPHVHIHLMPREKGDRLLKVYPSIPRTPSRDILEAIAEKIRHAL